MTAIATNRAPARTAAEELLQSELQSGPRHAAELVELAKARGHLGEHASSGQGFARH
jgi:hypothetical protein